MVLADIVELERCVTKGDGSLRINDLIGNHDFVGLERGDAALGVSMCDEARAKILEGPAAGNMVEMTVTVDDIFDWRLSHLLDRSDVGLRRASLADRVGGDNACGRDDEHRLMATVAGNVYVVAPFGCGERRWTRLLRLCGGGERAADEGGAHGREANPKHGRSPGKGDKS